MPRGAETANRVAQQVRNSWRVASDLGAATTLAIVANTAAAARRRRQERRAARMPATARGPGALLAVEAVPGGARCRFAEADLEVVCLAPDVVRVSWGPDRPPPPRGHPDPPELPACEVAVTEEGRGLRLETAALAIEVSPEGRVRYLDAGSDRVLRVEQPPLRRGATRILRSQLRRGEAVAGLGERAGGLDLRGGRYRLWNSDPGGAWGRGTDPLYCGIPVFVGLHPDGNVLVFHDNSYEAVAVLDGHAPRPFGDGLVELQFAAGMLRHYVVAGSLPRVMEGYASLTGLPALPPRWALGYQHCRWGYRSAAEVSEVSDGFEREAVPLSALYLDIDYMDGYRVFTVAPERFGDLEVLSSELSKRGTRLVTIVDPGVKVDPTFGVYREGLEGDHFVAAPGGGPLEGVVWPGRSAFPDFTAARTRRWWAGLYGGLFNDGVAGLWHDMNEPTSITLSGDPTLPKNAPHDLEGRGGSHLEAHNVYGLAMNRAGFAGSLEARPAQRPFLVSRSGWAGVQRWSWIWTGDAESTWEGLAQQVATLLGLGLSGVPFTGSDIGGFSGAPTPELYVRWLELSLFVPFCRTHSVLGAPPREPWRFPEPYRGIIGRLVRARYRLLPYLYTLAFEASRTGHPMLRPPVWPAVGLDGGLVGGGTGQAAPETFLLGDALVVAPVTEVGAAERRLWVPPGDWHRFHAADHPQAATGSLFGATTAAVAAPLGDPAVLVRAGAIVPLDSGWAGPGSPPTVPANHRPLRPTLDCWPDASGRAVGVLYDDDGDGEGPSRLEHLSFEPAAATRNGGWVLRREVEGSYPAPLAVEVVVHGLAVGAGVVDGVEVPVERGPGGVAVLRCPGDFGELRLAAAL